MCQIEPPPPPPFLTILPFSPTPPFLEKNLLSLPLLQNYRKSFPPFKGGFKLCYYFDFCIFIISDCSDRFLVGGVPTSICHFSCLSNCPSVRPSIYYSPCLRNCTSSDHNFWYTCVKWWYLYGVFFIFFVSFFWADRGVNLQK